MAHTLDDILTVGKSEAGKITYNPFLIDFNKFINPIINEVSNYFNQSHEIVLKINIPDNHNIYMDEKLGRNIFINLLMNAVKFSPSKNKIILEVEAKNRSVEIKVIDFGIGINKSDFKEVFNPFSRAENAEAIQGTGLGLSIVKQAIKLHDGKIKIQSIQNEKTTFTVTLPNKD
jgi:signal transduction histidine kinase